MAIKHGSPQNRRKLSFRDTTQLRFRGLDCSKVFFFSPRYLRVFDMLAAGVSVIHLHARLALRGFGYFANAECFHFAQAVLALH